MRTAICFLFLTAMLGCTHTQAVQQSSNPDVPVDLVLEHDGCKVYRFSDVGDFIYFTRCDTGKSTTSWTQQEGKTYRTMTVQTN